MASRSTKQQANSASSNQAPSRNSDFINQKSAVAAKMSQSGSSSDVKQLQPPVGNSIRNQSIFNYASDAGPPKSSSLRSGRPPYGGTSTKFDRGPSTLDWLAHQQQNGPLLKRTALIENPHPRVGHDDQVGRHAPHATQSRIGTQNERAHGHEPQPFSREELLRMNKQDFAQMGPWAYQPQHEDRRPA